MGFQLGHMTSKQKEALQLNQLRERSLEKLHKHQRTMQQAKQDEYAEKCRAGKEAAVKEAAEEAAVKEAAKEAAREAAANASKDSQPAVVQPLSSTAHMPAAAVDLPGVAEKGQVDVQVSQPVSKAEKARLQREMAHRRKAKAKEVKATARAAEDAADEHIAEQAAVTDTAEVAQYDDSQQFEEAAIVEDDAVEDVADARVDVDPQQVGGAEVVDDEVKEEIVVEDAPHTANVAQSEGSTAGHLAGDAPMPHAVNTRVADHSQQTEDAAAVEDVLNEVTVVDAPHAPSVAQSDGPTGVHHVAGDAPMPNAVEDVVDTRMDVDPQQVSDAESAEDEVSKQVVAEDAPHTPSVAQSEGPTAGHLAGDASMPHAVNTRVADGSQQEDAAVVEDVLNAEAVMDGPHSSSVAPSEGQSGVQMMS